MFDTILAAIISIWDAVFGGPLMHQALAIALGICIVFAWAVAAVVAICIVAAIVRAS